MANIAIVFLEIDKPTKANCGPGNEPEKITPKHTAEKAEQHVKDAVKDVHDAPAEDPAAKAAREPKTYHPTESGDTTTEQSSLQGDSGQDVGSSDADADADAADAADAPRSEDADNPPEYRSFRAAKRHPGSPGQGNVYDHVVEQSQVGRSGFDPEEIHNPFNVNPVSSPTNQLKANYYSSIDLSLVGKLFASS